jgi:nucleoid-associated protein YgaU
MAFFDFVKEAGEKLFGHGAKSQQTSSQMQAEAPQPASTQADVAAKTSEAEQAIANYIRQQNLEITGLTVSFDPNTSVATVFGVAKDQATKEKAVLCCGNVAGIARVDDKMTVDQSGPEAKFYTVKSGDTLSKIAKEFYQDANQYPKIFEANKPMLKSPDKIYPGQSLRIPD